VLAPAGVAAARVCISSVSAVVAADVAAGIAGATPAAVYVTNCSATATNSRRRQLAAATYILFSVSAVTAPEGSAQALWNALAALTGADFGATQASVQAAAGVAGAYIALPQTSAISAACGGGGSTTCGTLPTGPTTPSQGGDPPTTNVGAIVGGVIGGLAVLAIAAVGAVMLHRRRRATASHSSAANSRTGWGKGIDRQFSLRGEMGEPVLDDELDAEAIQAAARVTPRYGAVSSTETD